MDIVICEAQEGDIPVVEGVLRLDTHALRPRLRAFYERCGLVHVGTKVFSGDRHTAFYVCELRARDDE